MDAEEVKKNLQLRASYEQQQKRLAGIKLHAAKQMTQIIQVTIGVLAVDDDNALTVLVTNLAGIGVMKGAKLEVVQEELARQWAEQEKAKPALVAVP
jgi:hypothetical protein